MLHSVVVVVDDNTDFLTFVETLLAFAGYTVLSCQQSAQALALISKRQPDVVTLDIRMGEVDNGLDILTALRADSATASIPVLLCSADIEALGVFAAINTEPHTQVLAKPFDAHRLLVVLQDLQEKARSIA